MHALLALHLYFVNLHSQPSPPPSLTTLHHHSQLSPSPSLTTLHHHSQLSPPPSLTTLHHHSQLSSTITHNSPPPSLTTPPSTLIHNSPSPSLTSLSPTIPLEPIILTLLFLPSHPGLMALAINFHLLSDLNVRHLFRKCVDQVMFFTPCSTFSPHFRYWLLRCVQKPHQS